MRPGQQPVATEHHRTVLRHLLPAATEVGLTLSRVSARRSSRGAVASSRSTPPSAHAKYRSYTPITKPTTTPPHHWRTHPHANRRHPRRRHRCRRRPRTPLRPNLLAATCVHCNVTLDQVVPNTLNVLAIAGREDIPVASGMTRSKNPHATPEASTAKTASAASNSPPPHPRANLRRRRRRIQHPPGSRSRRHRHAERHVHPHVRPRILPSGHRRTPRRRNARRVQRPPLRSTPAASSSRG